MATVNLFLGKTKKEKANIRVRVSDTRLVDVYYTSDIIVDKDIWDSKTQNIKSRISISQTKKIFLISQINQLKQVSLQAYLNLKKSNETINSENFKQYVNELLYPQRQNKEDFFARYDEFLQAKQSVRQKEVRDLILLRKTLLRYQTFAKMKQKSFTLTLIGITETTLQDFKTFLINEYQYMNLPQLAVLYEKPKYKPRGQRKESTAVFFLRKLSIFYNWCIKKSYISQSPFVNYPLIEQKHTTPIVLLPQEVKEIWNYDFSFKKRWEQYRDMFVFQCMVGCRSEDLLLLKKNNVQDEMLSYIPLKTIQKQQKVIQVPLNSIAKEIIERYKDTDTDRLMPISCSYTCYLMAIKKIVAKVGLNREVIVLDKNGMPQTKQLKDIIGSHTARRTFISLLINNGVAPQIIASMSGHTPTSRAFNRYVAIGNDIKKTVITEMI